MIIVRKKLIEKKGKRNAGIEEIRKERKLCLKNEKDKIQK
jgi:hypothetical protein